MSDDESTEDQAGDQAEGQESEAPTLGPGPLEILATLEAELGEGVVEHANAFGNLVVRVRPDAWRRSAEVARDLASCDYLSFVSGIDWQPAARHGGDDDGGGDTSAPVQPTEMTFGAAGSAGRFQVFAHVQSTTRHHGVTLKTDVDEAAPSAQSWVSVYPGADWHERECWEMFGFDFVGHPSLRHLVLPGDFEGHPLRKDFALLAREVKPWPGLVGVEAMPEPESEPDDEGTGG